MDPSKQTMEQGAAPGYYPPQGQQYPQQYVVQQQQYPQQYPQQQMAYYPPPQQAGAVAYIGAQYASQPNVVVVQAPAPNYAVSGVGFTCAQKSKSGYGVFRILQALLSLGELIACIMFLVYSSDSKYFFSYYYYDVWYYWCWILVMPLASLSTSLSQLCNPRVASWAYGGGGDIALAIFWGIQAASLATIYWLFYAIWMTPSQALYGDFATTTNVALAFSGLLQLTYWITGYSACCCKCLECGMPHN